MCSHSSVDEMLGNLSSSSSSLSSPAVPTISAVQLRHRRDAYYLIDIREAEEIAADPLVTEMVEDEDEDEDGDGNTHESVAVVATTTEKVTADIEVPMGKLLAKGVAEEWIDQRGIVLLCNTGYRASITARELAKRTPQTKVLALQAGMVGLRNPAATIPDMIVVLATSTHAEKLTLALNAAAVAAAAGETVVLALMGDGVQTFLRKGSNKNSPEKNTFLVQETFIGEPFSPCQALLKKLVGSGHGVVLACKSCLASRDIQLGSDLLDCVKPMQMPDLIRMLGQAKKNLQFM